MINPDSGAARARTRRAMRVLATVTAALIAVGPLVADQTVDYVGYCLIVSAAVLPLALWIRGGAQGIPIIPVIALAHIVYFAVPILRGSPAELGYDDDEILRAAATVCLFLVVMTSVSQLFALRRLHRIPSYSEISEKRELSQLIAGGLLIGVAYQSANLAGALNWLGTLSGLVRAVSLTLVTASCYLFGVAYGRRLLSFRVRTAAQIGLALNVMLNWMSLFLVGGMFFLLAAALGYAISTARVPWRAGVLALVVVGILHAGKAEMRERYWEDRSNYVEYFPMPSFPVLAVEWVSAGIAALASGEVGKDVSKRTSLVWILMHVQRVAPTPIPYLEGATYALLPQMLVPRFLDPEKISSQAGMNLLNVHFGILSEEETSLTAVGWGPLAEGYANFGYLGVAGAAVALGLLGGALTWRSVGAAPVSLPALLAIAAMLQMANMEADVAYLLTSLSQSFAGVLVYFGVFRFLMRRRAAARVAQQFAAPPPTARSE